MNMENTRHVPVLPDAVLQFVAPAAGEIVVDATLGGAGHAVAMAERLGREGRLIGLDRDPAALERARGRLEQLTNGPRVELGHANFEHLRRVLDERGIERVDAVLADLGFSSD